MSLKNQLITFEGDTPGKVNGKYNVWKSDPHIEVVDTQITTYKQWPNPRKFLLTVRYNELD